MTGVNLSKPHLVMILVASFPGLSGSEAMILAELSVYLCMMHTSFHKNGVVISMTLHNIIY